MLPAKKTLKARARALERATFHLAVAAEYFAEAGDANSARDVSSYAYTRIHEADSSFAEREGVTPEDARDGKKPTGAP